MTYVMSDLHGCYDKYMQMLDKIHFCEEDELFILGDIIDRGANGIKILRHMMMYPNVFPIIGNHEFDAFENLKTIFDSNGNGSFLGCLRLNLDEIDKDELTLLQVWLILNGGESTMREFNALLPEERQWVYEYLSGFSPYEVILVEGRIFVLTHSGVSENMTIEGLLNANKYMDEEFMFSTTDYSKTYFSKEIAKGKSVFLITGHTPTVIINPEYTGKIYRNNYNIAIDCGVVFFGTLGCLCLETDEEFYV